MLALHDLLGKLFLDFEEGVVCIEHREEIVLREGLTL